MTGRGIDQVPPHSSLLRIYEPYVTDSGEEVRLAETAYAPITKPLGFPL
jgi:hypothetical protein